MRDHGLRGPLAGIMALVLMGCGGGGGGEESPAPPPSPLQITSGPSRNSVTSAWVASSCVNTTGVILWFGADGTCGQSTSMTGCLFANCTWSQSGGSTVNMGGLPSGSSCVSSIANVQAAFGGMSGRLTLANGSTPAFNTCFFTQTACPVAGVC